MGFPAVVLPAGTLCQRRYEVVRCLKAGGMGVVYEVVDRVTHRRRALKMMLPGFVADPDLLARFNFETIATANVESEHVVETFDAGIDAESGAPFLVMELLRGEDLGSALKKRGRFPPAEALVLLGQAALALDQIHAAGVIHRDLKPANLFLARRDDGSPWLKVLDFGIAKFVAQSTQSMHTTTNMGTPIYMSPEQMQGEGAIDHRADLYALGHITYALLVGEPFWKNEGHAREALYQILLKIMKGGQEPASSRAEKSGVTLPARFDAWFARATAPLPHDRFDSASQLVEELALVLAPEARSAAAPEKLETVAWVFPKRSLVPVGVGSISLAMLAGVVLLWMTYAAPHADSSGQPALPSPSASSAVMLPSASTPAPTASATTSAPAPTASAATPTPVPTVVATTSTIVSASSRPQVAPRAAPEHKGSGLPPGMESEP
jgi:serine/threonine-protein kinase